MSDKPETKKPPAGTKAPEDLFDVLGEDGKQFKKEQPASTAGTAPSASSAASKEPVKKPEPKKYPAGTEFKRSGHTIVLPGEMTEKEIFELLEDDFPEITPDRAELRFDKEKGRLYALETAQKKGAGEDLDGEASADGAESGWPLKVLWEPPERGSYPPVFRILGEDGVYEVRKTPLGTFIVRVPSGMRISAGFYPVVPRRCPASLLATVVDIFKERPEVEALVNIVYDTRDGEFHLVWTEHAADAASVDYVPLPEIKGTILYAEVHSHHRMPAFFSRTDDESEVRTGIYGVIGRVNRPRPEALFRYSCGGIFGPVRAESLFDDAAAVRSVVEPVGESDDPSPDPSYR